MIALRYAKYIPTVLAILAAAGAAWYVMDLRADVASLRAENDKLTVRVAACSARLNNIQKDRESDAEVDNWPDLRDVPDHWLFPTPGSGGLY